MRLVIFSYPNHYQLMQLAYQNAIVNLENITQVTVVWDDLHENTVPDIPIDADIIAHSDIDFLSVENHGWLRQQYVKLNLHKLFKDNEWIVLDSDVMLKTKKSFANKEIYTDRYDYYEPYFKFIKHAFGINKNNSPSYMTHFGLIERDVLLSIEQFIFNKHGCSLIEVYKNYQDVEPPACPGFSEFEIYGLYQERIMGRKINLPEYVIENYLADNFILNYDKPHDLLLEGKDEDIPFDFWQKQNIKFKKSFDF